MTRDMDLAEELAGVDIYLLDQWLRGRIAKDARVLDAGCGRGRNLRPFLLDGQEIWVLDSNAEALAEAEKAARDFGVVIPPERRIAEAIEGAELAPSSFDFIVCNAVLHFARDEDHFSAMTKRLYSWLKPGGLVFTRLASRDGLDIEACAKRSSRWGRFPDGDEHFLSDLSFLLEETRKLGAELADPIKTVNVQNRRAMTTWVWRRPA